MKWVNVAEAKARLSQLIDAALDGEEVVIARRNTPLVRLTTVKAKKRAPRFGAFKDRIFIAPTFDEPLEDFAAYMPAARPRRRR